MRNPDQPTMRQRATAAAGKVRASVADRGYGAPKGMKMITVLRIAAKIPRRAWRPLSRFAARWAVFRNYKAVRQWRLNAEVMLGREPTRKETIAGMFSWFENLSGSVKMAKYSPAENIRRVVVDDESLARYKAAFGTTGVLLALPHMGDWDLAGAWSCAIGVPISSVAERLPDEEFEYFMRLRSKVGMTIYSHKDPNAVEKLKEDLANHRVVALLADRDLSRHGVPVVWHTASGDRDVTMPPGPAVIAGATGVALMPAICTYERDLRMRVRFLEPIEVDTGEEGVQRTTQRLADVFCREVAAKVTDWHVLQRFFPGVVAD